MAETQLRIFNVADLAVGSSSCKFISGHLGEAATRAACALLLANQTQPNTTLCTVGLCASTVDDDSIFGVWSKKDVTKCKCFAWHMLTACNASPLADTNGCTVYCPNTIIAFTICDTYVDIGEWRMPADSISPSRWEKVVAHCYTEQHVSKGKFTLQGLLQPQIST